MLLPSQMNSVGAILDRKGLVVNLDSQQAETSSLISGGKVDSLLVDLDRPDLCVDDDLAVVLELVGGCVKLVEEEGEGLLALQRRPGEQVAVAQAELHLEKRRRL